FPQPCTPVISTPFGGTSPNRRPSGVKAFFLFAIQSRRCRNPATSINDASRRTVSSNPSVLSASCFALRFPHRIEQPRIGLPSLEHALPQRAQGLFLRQANQILRQLRHRGNIERDSNVPITA